MVDLELIIGAPLLLAPGVALTWAYIPELDLPKFIATSVILSVTVPPAIVLLLNVLLGVPVTALNVVLVWLLVTWVALAGRFSRLASPAAA